MQELQHEAQDAASIAAAEEKVVAVALNASMAANKAAAARLAAAKAAATHAQEAAVQARQEVLALEGRADAHEDARSRGELHPSWLGTWHPSNTSHMQERRRVMHRMLQQCLPALRHAAQTLLIVSQPWCCAGVQATDQLEDGLRRARLATATKQRLQAVPKLDLHIAHLKAQVRPCCRPSVGAARGARPRAQSNAEDTSWRHAAHRL